MPEFPELIVHIGAGKTGSTSIQFSLRDAADALARQNVSYMGLMLEKLPEAQTYDWCVQGQPQRYFQSRNAQQTDEELYQVLRGALIRMNDEGITRAIWSNEAFLVQSRRVLPVLSRLAGDGVKIRLVCYVRRHDKRARSAYVEFGLKSKRNTGSLRTFREWADRHPLEYAKNLAPWQAAFPQALELYNFDTVGDVGAHFTNVIGLKGIASVRANESPSKALLAAWTVYNDGKQTPTWAGDFRRLTRPMQIHEARIRPVPPLGALMPSAADLTGIQDRFRPDMEQINALLTAQGQPPMSFGDVQDSDDDVTPWDMEQMLLRMVLSLQEQVQRLQQQVDTLSDKSGSDKA